MAGKSFFFVLPASAAGAMWVCNRLHEAGHLAVLAGGAVRDLLMGETPHDFDVASTATPEEAFRIFGPAFRPFKGEDHGTVLIVPPGGEPIELTTFRKDVECDGRHAQVAWTTDVVEDLQRRDLTINALALDPIDGVLYGPGLDGDPTQAMADLRSRTIRFVGDGFSRISEDWLRAFRACRFTGKGFILSPEAARAITGALPVLRMRKLVSQRVGGEICKALASSDPITPLRWMMNLGLMELVLPELAALKGLAQNTYHKYDAWEHTLQAVAAAEVRGDYGLGLTNVVALRLAMLFHDCGKSMTAAFQEGYGNSFLGHDKVGAEIAARILGGFDLPKGSVEPIISAIAGHMCVPGADWSPKAVRRWVRTAGANQQLMLDVRRADRLAHGMDRLLEVIQAENHITDCCTVGEEASIARLVNGTDLIAMGMRPGRAIGQVLSKIDLALEDQPMNRDEQIILAYQLVAAAA